MAIKTKRMSDWLAQNGEAITNASKASMLKAVNDEVTQLYDGIYIVYDSLKFSKIECWNTLKDSNTPIGILIAENDINLILAITETSLPISNKEFTSGNSYIYNYVSAIKDLNGKENSKNILNASNGDIVTNTIDYAVGYCNEYSALNSEGHGIAKGKWWLPSVGELYVISKYINKINYALSIIDGANTINKKSNHWSSTEYSVRRTWGAQIGNFEPFGVWSSNTSFNFVVRPVSRLQYVL